MDSLNARMTTAILGFSSMRDPPLIAFMKQERREMREKVHCCHSRSEADEERGDTLLKPIARAKSRAVTFISKYLRKPERALLAILARSFAGSAANRRMRLRVPSSESGSTKPQPDPSTSR